MVLDKGTKVRVILLGTDERDDFHNFEVGQIVTALGEAFEYNKVWQKFRAEDGETQYLQDHHFELKYTPDVKGVSPEKILDEEVKVVDSDLPSKVAYAIVNRDNEIIGTRHDRDDARRYKALLGGKRKGIRIFEYAATKEIR